MPAPDYTEMFNTKLDPKTEQLFRNWIMRSGKQRDLYDYDLRGAFSNGVTASANGHLPDTYKKPNHPTFSNESIYSNEASPGGAWEKVGDKWRYKPSAFNLGMHGAEGLQNYFMEREPDAQLLMPTEAN